MGTAKRLRFRQVARHRWLVLSLYRGYRGLRRRGSFQKVAAMAAGRCCVWFVVGLVDIPSH